MHDSDACVAVVVTRPCGLVTMGEDYLYDWRPHDRIDDALLVECATLFSEHYGIWGTEGRRPGERIRLRASDVARFLPQDGWAVFARHDGALVGYALGIRTAVEGVGAVDWVTQLVVHTDHRARGVASALLFTFWGFSNHAAWGLVTSNPYAVRALERITRRRCDPRVIRDMSALIRRVGERIHYVKDQTITLDGARSVIDTRFFISHATLSEKLRRVREKAPWMLGDIGEGEEWLAFTFRSQEPMPLTPEDLSALLDRSDRTVKGAYGRMNLDARHRWASASAHEVDVAVRELDLKASARVLDVGCGRGRHALLLAGRGYDVTGVDFVDGFIDAAKESARENGVDRARFVTGDARSVDLDAASFDAIVCLYDVIGTFPDQEDNQRVVDNLARHLKPGGRVLASVMNLELTRLIARHHADVANNPRALQELPPSVIMQQSGDVYDPTYFLLDSTTGIVYRKEQFDGDGRPPGEYVIRDRRYSRDDIRAMCERAGLRLLWTRPVALREWDEAREVTDPKAKEILFLAERAG